MTNINVDAPRRAVLNALDVYIEASEIDMLPHMTANITKQFSDHLFKDDGVDFDARLSCFNQAVRLVKHKLNKTDSYDFVFDEERLKEKFIDIAEEDDIHAHSFVVRVLDQCSALEYGLGLIEKPSITMHTNYTYTTEVKERPSGVVRYRMKK